MSARLAGRSQVLEGTAEHPVYVPSRGRWVQMQHMVAGMDLLGLGETAIVEGAVRQARGATVYNLSVDQTRSFFAAGILVHNSIDDFGFGAKPDGTPREFLYEPNPKHGTSQRGRSSPEPSDPQLTLDGSIPFNPSSSRRGGNEQASG